MSTYRKGYADPAARRTSTTAELQGRRAERQAREAERRTPAPLDTAALEAELHAAQGVAR